MQKSVLIGFAILALTAAAVSAQGKTDCGSAYKSSLDRLRQKQLSPARLAALSRQALRIYNACQSDDLVNPASLFQNLDRLKD
jgi:hypothetical protein